VINIIDRLRSFANFVPYYDLSIQNENVITIYQFSLWQFRLYENFSDGDNEMYEKQRRILIFGALGYFKLGRLWKVWDDWCHAN